jgi:tellurite resistance protein
LTAVTRTRIVLGRYAIALGFAGLGGVWTEAQSTVNASPLVGLCLVVAAFIVWLWLTVRYVVGLIRSPGALAADLDHETTGPSVAYLPVVAILITTHFHAQLGSVAPWINGIFVAMLAVVCAFLLTRWVSGSFAVSSPHPGYFLPVVAGPFIASLGFSTEFEHGAAVAAFGVGVFFWAITGSVVFGRLMTGGPLAPGSLPSLGILLAPPATGGVAWFAANGGHPDSVTDVLGGVLVLMLLLQLCLIPRYRRGGFSLDFWAFSFPLASTANYSVRLGFGAHFTGWQAFSWAAITIVSLCIGALCVGTVVLVVKDARRRNSTRNISARQL